ncbi:dicarboxylate/amino acid:cation symporter [Sphingomonas oligophenolica]|uniref:Dicarboxylate/amino acid:cation symporter n=1 Tax=Sphingomonas oligophenolica TaxID=301154 RepID=A0A502CF93_9SPHN|nr:cation:dicarboxylase symporter family transporter [Sphingomonas oligophenolica]TPG10426.1 dicarboxylate/amino acid:cation symporter [Sphingomonas oligophenolica]
MSQAMRILVALIAGLVIGIAAAALAPGAVPQAIAVAEPIGAAWLAGLQMTIVPLVIALLVVGVAATAEAARAGRIAGMTLAISFGFLWCSALAAAVLTPLFLDLAPLPAASAEALRTALAGTAKISSDVPTLADFFSSIVPTNVIAAAANNAFLSLIVFTLVFAFAITRIEPARRVLLTGVFEALKDTMLVVINWVLWLAPIGVLALAFTVGAKTGTAAFGALVHYILVVSAVGVVIWAAAYPLALIGGRVKLGAFARASLASQAVAISTESSLASLPAMLKGAERLGIPTSTSGVVLPLAVAVFRSTGPAMNLAVAIYVANWFGVPLTAGSLAAGIAVAALTSLGSVSLPGQISYISSIAPIAITMGVPIAPLGLLVAVETIPDIIRTLGNVTNDLALTATVAARSGVAPRDAGDAILEE